MADPIRLYLVRVWNSDDNKYLYRVMRAYSAEDVLTQWRVEHAGGSATSAPSSIEPLDENDPRLFGWKYKPPVPGSSNFLSSCPSWIEP